MADRYQVRPWGDVGDAGEQARAYDTLRQCYVCAPVSPAQAQATAEALNRLAALSQASRGEVATLPPERPRLWLVRDENGGAA